MSGYMYTSRHIAALYNITKETVRIWSEEFARYLSSSANPGKNKQRLFNEDDMRVFALIAELKKENLTFQDIHAALQNGQRGTLPELPPEEIQAIVLTEQENKLAIQVELLERKLAATEQEYNATLEKLAVLQEVEKDKIRLEVRLEESEKQLIRAEKTITELQKRLQELEREAGEAYYKGIIDTLRKEQDSSGD